METQCKGKDAIQILPYRKTFLPLCLTIHQKLFDTRAKPKAKVKTLILFSQNENKMQILKDNVKFSQRITTMTVMDDTSQ